MTPEQHRAWLDAALTTLSARDDVVGVVAMGSTADTSRVDEWSDHDLGIVVQPESTELLRDGAAWLPDVEHVVVRTVEHHGGGKAFYDDGHLVEWGVTTLDGLRTWLADDYRVLLDRGGVAEVMAHIAAQPFAANQVDAQRDVAIFLFALIHGVGRSRRGELLSAGTIIRTDAVAALLRAVRATVASEHTGALDRIDGLRRVERAYPKLAAQIAEAIALEPEPAARALLEIADRHLEVGAGGIPPEARAAVVRRLGWSATP